jgi:hypothetical protein
MQLLGRTERWLIVQRERTRRRNEELQSQRDAARQKVARLRVRLAEQREKRQALRKRIYNRPLGRARRLAARLLGR